MPVRAPVNPVEPNPPPPHGWPAFEERSVPGVLRRTALAFPDKTALMDASGSLTYSELWSLSLRRAAGLLELGVKPGDRVILMLDNHLDYVASWFAVSLVRAVLVPVNTAYRGVLLEHVVEKATCDVAIAEAQYVERLIPDSTHQNWIRALIVRGRLEVVPDWLSVPLVDLETLDLASELRSRPEVAPWHTHSLMLTSGTTGPSRLVSVPHGLTYSDSDPEWFPGAGFDDTVLVTLPLFHVSGAGAVYNAVVVGATVAIADRFHSSTFWDDATRFGASFTPILGIMPKFLMNRPASPSDRSHSIRRIRMAPVIADLDGFRDRFGVVVGSAYGMTEVSNPIVAPFGGARPGACGWLRPDFDVRVVDEHDREVAAGQIGELVVRPKVPWTVSTGYFGDPEITSAGWRNLWFHTGDALRVDANGEYYFMDRLKDAIRRRGENISSFEVEQVINSHPAVEESAVVGVRDDDGDEEVHAVVVPTSQGALSPEGLVAYLSERLPTFMVPKFVTLTSGLPKTPSGKVSKYSLRQEGVGERTWSNPSG